MFDNLKFRIVDTQCLLEEFLMWFDEKFLGRCGVCRRKNGTGHKMDCYREYTRQVNREG